MRLIDADELKTAFPCGESVRTECVRETIDHMPTIQPDPERKKGKWIDKSDGIEGAWNYCSICREQAIDLYDFCPNCGADMRGDSE